MQTCSLQKALETWTCCRKWPKRSHMVHQVWPSRGKKGRSGWRGGWGGGSTPPHTSPAVIMELTCLPREKLQAGVNSDNSCRIRREAKRAPRAEASCGMYNEWSGAGGWGAGNCSLRAANVLSSEMAGPLCIRLSAAFQKTGSHRGSRELQKMCR